jgi:hypothetical protein
LSYNKWTREEEQLLIQNVRYDHRGFVCNCNELAELLGIDKKRIWSKIHQMRKKDLIDEVYWDDPIEPPNKRYSQQEDKKIISMYQSGCPVTIIAQELNRTENAIRCRLNIMKKNGQLESNRKRRYTKREVELLISEIKFDKNGYVLNIDYLTRLLHRPKHELFRKICLLRKQGEITIKPDRTKASQNWYDVMKKQIDNHHKLIAARYSYQKKTRSPASKIVS